MLLILPIDGLHLTVANTRQVAIAIG
jgi:hypothetical protein